MLPPIADRFAGALGRRDFEPNVALAAELADTDDAQGVADVAACLESGRRRVARDAIHVLFALAERAPELALAQADVLLDALHDEDGRVVWGAVHAWSSLAGADPARCMAVLPHVMDAARRSNIVARHRTMLMLAELGKHAEYQDEVAPLALELVRTARPNQFPTYAALAEESLVGAWRGELLAVVRENASMVERWPAKVRVVERVLGRLGEA